MRENSENRELTINLLDVLKALLHKWWLIFLMAVVAGGLFFGYTYLNTEQYYEARVLMYVNSKDVSIGSYSVSLGDLNASRSLVATYSVIAKSRGALESVVDNAVIYYKDGSSITLKDKYRKKNLDVNNIYTYSYLAGKVSVGSVNDTEVFSVKVQSTDPDDAMAIANAFVEIFPENVSKIIIGTVARPVEYAETAVPIDRGFVKMTAIGLAVGAVLAAAIIFITDVLANDTIISEDWIHEAFGDDVPMLTVIPEEEGVHHTGKYGYYKYDYKYYYKSGYGNQRTPDDSKKKEETK